MAGSAVQFTVFTKPWKVPLPQLSAFVRQLGVDGVELPVRPGYQVQPEAVRTALPEAARVFAAEGLVIASVAGPTDEPTIATCGELGIPLIRICVDIPAGRDYLAQEAQLQRDFDALVPLLDRAGVTLGIQNHYGRHVANAMGLRHLIERYDPRHIAAVLDPAHCGLNGEQPDLALDIVWSHLRMVNLKNAFWRRTTGPEAPVARYAPYWTSGRHGLCAWDQVAGELQRRAYRGPVCLTAEYTDEQAVDRLIAEDVRYARSLFA
jgi:sugar phosphate isomerase/epimerase